MKKPAFREFLYILGIAAITACIIFETAALLHGEKSNEIIPAAADEENVYDLTDKDSKLLAEFVSAEVGDKPFLCKVAVAAVVFNRIRSTEYPQNLSDVIFQPNAFKSTANGRLKSEEDYKKLSSAMNAVSVAKQGEDPTNGALNYFFRYDPDADTSHALFYIEDMVFTQ